MSDLSIKPWVIIAGVGIVVILCTIGFLVGAAFNQFANPISSRLFGMFNEVNPGNMPSPNWSPRFSSGSLADEPRIDGISCGWDEDGNDLEDCFQEERWERGGMMTGGSMMGHRGGGGGRWEDTDRPKPSTILPTPNAQVSFEQDVLPIFETYCTSCHGNQAGLSLETYEKVIKGSNHGAVIIPGDPQRSPLIRLVSSGTMPYGGPPLSQEQIQVLVNWVGSGALDN